MSIVIRRIVEDKLENLVENGNRVVGISAHRSKRSKRGFRKTRTSLAVMINGLQMWDFWYGMTRPAVGRRSPAS